MGRHKAKRKGAGANSGGQNSETHNEQKPLLSKSAELRTAGNTKLAASRVFGLAPPLALGRCTAAQQLYQQAVQAAKTMPERSSALKNVAVAHADMARLQAYVYADGLTMRHHVLDALQTFNAALAAAEGGAQSAAWKSTVEALAVNVVIDACEYLQRARSLLGVDLPHVVALEGLCQAALPMSLPAAARAVLYFSLARATFQCAVRERECRVYASAHQWLSKVEGNLEEAASALAKKKKCFKAKNATDATMDAYFAFEDAASQVPTMLVAELQEESMRIESSRLIEVGDAVLDHALYVEESINMDMVWQALDYFYMARSQAKESDMETEARACSRIGSTWKVLSPRDYDRAYVFNLECVRLVMAMYPITLDRTRWFKEAREAVDEYQEMRRRKMDSEEEKEKVPIREQLSEELTALKEAADKGHIHLLDHVYNVVKPRVKGATRKDEQGLKEQLKAAIVHFHPDRNHAWGKQWEVLCDEVTKLLNVAYTMHKC